MAPTPPDTPADAPHAPMDEHDALPAGTRFGELEILRVLGVGGFGIVYLAQDHALERQVALKEYMPSSLAGRGKGMMVSIRSGAHTETYALGLRSFVNEARLLARFNHPSLVKVYRFWEENGTAYMVMPYLQGRTLRDVRRSMSAAPTEAWMRSVITPLLDALDQLHREDVFHRDIAPDNILLPPGELPVLLDFGAARRAIGDRTQTFTAILKPSYAPIEQYAEVVQLRQGPWTDLYALGAVVYYLLRGVPPPPATARAVQDDTPLLAPEDCPGVSAHFIAAVEWALAIRPTDRPQNIGALREVMEGRATVPPRTRTGTTAPPSAAMADAPTVQVARTTLDTSPIEPTRPMTSPRTQPSVSPAPPAPAMAPKAEPATAPKTAPPAAASPREPQTVMPSRPTVDAPPRHAQVRPSRAGWLVAVLGAFVALAAGAAWLIGGRTPAAPAAPVTPAAVSAPAEISGAPLRPAATDAAGTLPARAAPAPPSAAPLPSPAAEGPATPRQACGSRAFLALAVCMEEQCLRPRFKSHPQCRRVQKMIERRQQQDGG